MTKKEIIDRASEISGIPQTQIRNCMEAIIKAILEALSEKKKVTLHNFGSFFTKEMKARIAMNPRDKKKICLDARTVIKFKISPKFKFKDLSDNHS
ncbi:HU family DNA-binding protein [Bacteroides sp.]|uniref:HU family DNA-binding protein n=1 Tax=Bacteroides sp. TaxID=29523 RepID=UPI0025C459BC|nr:HU family DNA-binding protein [Bacteroides sp.]